ncbi:hypothetical protein ACP70R_015100 [Stipagrostis hirtigluma subsp. patula]
MEDAEAAESTSTPLRNFEVTLTPRWSRRRAAAAVPPEHGGDQSLVTSPAGRCRVRPRSSGVTCYSSFIRDVGLAASGIRVQPDGAKTV